MDFNSLTNRFKYLGMCVATGSATMFATYNIRSKYKRIKLLKTAALYKTDQEYIVTYQTILPMSEKLILGGLTLVGCIIGAYNVYDWTAGDTALSSEEEDIFAF